MEAFGFKDISLLLANEEPGSDIIPYKTSTHFRNARRKSIYTEYDNEGFEGANVCESQNPPDYDLRKFHPDVDQRQHIDQHTRSCRNRKIQDISIISGHTVNDVHVTDDDVPFGMSLPPVFYNNINTEPKTVQETKIEYEKLSETVHVCRFTRETTSRHQLGESNIYNSHADPARAFYSAIYIDSNLGLPIFGDV